MADELDLSKNAIYQLIRQRAGSKMLRQAEEIQMYIRVQYYLEEDCLLEAIKEMDSFYETYYPLVEETPMGSISLCEFLDATKGNEIHTLPWIYGMMLQTITSGLPYLEVLVDKMLKTPWRVPLKEGVQKKDAFMHTYLHWMMENDWIDGFNRFRNRCSV